jgi:hypothetical protein
VHRPSDSWRFRFRVWGIGRRVQSLEFRVKGIGLRVEGLGCRGLDALQCVVDRLFTVEVGGLKNIRPKTAKLAWAVLRRYNC